MNTERSVKTEPATSETLHFVDALDGTIPIDVLVHFSSYDVAVEEVTPNSGPPGRRAWKSFEHYKASRSSNNPLTRAMPVCAEKVNFIPHHHVAYGSSSRFGSQGYNNVGALVVPFGEPGLPTQGLSGFYVKRATDGGFVPPPDNLSELESMAMKTMLPTIKAELSLVNSLIELKDFKSLPDTLNLITRLAFKGERTLRWFFKASSDGYLQTKFNILPLLSDITGIHTALSRIEKRINDLITRSGCVQHRHFAYSWHEFDDVNDELSDAYWPVSLSDIQRQFVAYFLHRRVSHDASVFHAEIEFNYNFTQYQVEHARLLGLLDAFGVNLNPSIIWNAIPWSFVVDWVIGVGRWLDQFKVLNMEPKINIRRYLWSVKRSRTIFVDRSYASGDSRVPLSGIVPMSATRETAYRRYVTMPSLGSILSSGLSPTEFSLGAALVIGRRRIPKQRNFS
jgi:hypothetical protein